MHRSVTSEERGSETNIVNHVGIPGIRTWSVGELRTRIQGDWNARHVVEELGERLDRVGPEVVELIDELRRRLVCNGARANRRRLVREEVAVVGRRQLHLEVYSQ
jgi:hypothetical protein